MPSHRGAAGAVAAAAAAATVVLVQVALFVQQSKAEESRRGQIAGCFAILIRLTDQTAFALTFCSFLLARTINDLAH